MDARIGTAFDYDEAIPFGDPMSISSRQPTIRTFVFSPTMKTRGREPYKRVRVLGGAALMALGFITLAIVALILMSSKGGINNSYSIGGSYVKNVKWQVSEAPHLSTWASLAAAALGAGMLLILGRYSLRWMLALMLMSGMAGVVPAMMQRQPSYVLRMSYGFPISLPATTAQKLQAALQPARALATLPTELRRKYDLLANGCVSQVSVGMSGNGALDFRVELSPGLTAEQRDILYNFYVDYAEVLSVTHAVSAGARVTSPSLFCFNNDSPWMDYRTAWLQSLPNLPPVLLATIPANGGGGMRSGVSVSIPQVAQPAR